MVLRTISRAACGKHRHRTPIGIQEHLLACRNQKRIVVFREFTSGSINKRHLVIIVEGIDVDIGEDFLASQAPHTAVSCVYQQ